MITLSKQSSCLFGISVAFFPATDSPKINSVTINGTEEAEQFCYEKDLELVRKRVISWHSAMSYNVRFTWCNNKALVSVLRPILKEVYTCADRLHKSNTREKNYELIDVISIELQKAKPSKIDKPGYTKWLHIFQLVEDYRTRYLVTATV